MRLRFCNSFPARLLAALVMLPALTAVSTPARGQVPSSAKAAAVIDPSDLFWQAYLNRRDSEKLEASGNFTEALNKLELSRKLVESVGTYYPNWKPDMVKGRIAITRETIARLQPKADAQRNKEQHAIAELEGGTRIAGRIGEPTGNTTGTSIASPQPSSAPSIQPLDAERLATLQSEVSRLRSQLDKTQQNDNEISRLRAQLARAQRDSAEATRLRQQLAEAQRDTIEASRLREQLANIQHDNAEAARLREQLAKAQKSESEAAHLREQLAKARQDSEEATRLRQQLADAQRDTIEASRLREQLAKLQNGSLEASKNQSRINDLAAQRDQTQAQLNKAEADLEALRARLATAPVQSEMDQLNQRIQSLEKEREAMAMALSQSRGEHTQALARADILQADLNNLRQKAAELQRNLDVQTKTSGEVVAGQRAQLKQLQDALKAKDADLAKASTQITGLQKQLEESQAAFTQLRGERDSLARERDQMSALLKLNEAGRIQQLIEQNMTLAKNLREANEKVERLNIDNNSTKDDLNGARRDLAIAKANINRLQRENHDQDKHIEELNQRLKQEQGTLAKGEGADPAELQVLREIVKKQLRVQERRRQAKDLLVEAVKNLGKKDETIGRAIELFNGGEVTLTPEEQKLVAGGGADVEFVSPFARDRKAVESSTTDLNDELNSYDRAAKKAFAAGRFLPAKELYTMIVDAHPGHTAALCKLGVVQLRIDDPAAAADAFRRAAELDANNPYAHRMLGYALFKLGQYPDSEASLQRAVELSPTDAKAHVLLGNLALQQNRLPAAENEYKAACSADPTLGDALYNLALLCIRGHRIEEAKNYYQQALDAGALPDLKLEQRLDEAKPEPITATKQNPEAPEPSDTSSPKQAKPAEHKDTKPSPAKQPQTAGRKNDTAGQKTLPPMPAKPH